MKIEPYLFFNGRCDEAIAFYKEALGAEVTLLMRMNEAPDPPPPGAIPPGFEHKVKSTAWAVPSRTRQAFFSLRVAPRSLPSG